MEHAAALGCAPLAEGEQAAEAAVGSAVLRIAEERKPAREIEPRAGEEPQARPLRRHSLGCDSLGCDSLGCDVGPHRAGQRVAVGDADGGEPEFRRPLHQLVRVGGPAQEAEVAHRLQLGVGDVPAITHIAQTRTRGRGPNGHLPLSPSPGGGGGTLAATAVASLSSPRGRRGPG